MLITSRLLIKVLRWLLIILYSLGDPPSRSVHDRLGEIVTSPNIKKEPQDIPVARYNYTPCKFHAMGHCVKGDKCDFLHEKPRENSRNFIVLSDAGSDSDDFDDYVPTGMDYQPPPENNRKIVIRNSDEIEYID